MYQGFACKVLPRLCVQWLEAWECCGAGPGRVMACHCQIVMVWIWLVRGVCHHAWKRWIFKALENVGSDSRLIYFGPFWTRPFLKNTFVISLNIIDIPVVIYIFMTMYFPFSTVFSYDINTGYYFKHVWSPLGCQFSHWTYHIWGIYYKHIV